MSATVWCARSRSSRTTIRARSSRFRERRRAWAGSCATSSRSARGRSRCSTRCASARFRASPPSRARYLLDGAVAGIGHYGNSIGVPTVGGEVYFEGPYEQNCLVNAMALGLCEREKLVRSAAAGVGNPLVLFGARTGRDGIGGASVLASAELGDADRRGQAPDGAGGRPVRGEEAARVLAGAAGARAARRAAGPRRGGTDLVGRGDGIEGRGRDRHRRRAGPAARAGDGAVRGDGERVPGADAVRGRAGERGRGAGAVREVGGQRRGDRHGHRHEPDAGLRRRAARRRHARQGARRRLPAVRPRAGQADGADLCGARGDARGGRLPPRDPARPAGISEHRLAPAAVRAVRRDRPVAHRAPARAGRRGGARARLGPLHRGRPIHRRPSAQRRGRRSPRWR